MLRGGLGTGKFEGMSNISESARIPQLTEPFTEYVTNLIIRPFDSFAVYADNVSKNNLNLHGKKLLMLKEQPESRTKR